MFLDLIHSSWVSPFSVIKNTLENLDMHYYYAILLAVNLDHKCAFGLGPTDLNGNPNNFHSHRPYFKLDPLV